MFARMLLTVAILAGAAIASADAAEPTTEEILTRWAEASRQGPRLSPAVLRTRYGAVHSAHELEAASDLLGAVDARELQERFDWRVEVSGEGTLMLIGQPSDTVDQLFYSQLEIAVDASTGLPSSIHFVASDGTPRPVAIRQRPSRPEPMILRVAAAEEGGAPLVHTAAFIPPVMDKNGAVVADVDVVQILRKWEQYRRRHNVRAVADAAWIESTADGTTAHVRSTSVSPDAGYGSTVTLKSLIDMGDKLPGAADHAPSAEAMHAVTRLFESRVEQLLTLYEWKVVAADTSTIVLEARPRNRSGTRDRYRFQLAIDPETGAGISISIRDLRVHPELRSTPPGEISPAAEAGPIPARR